MRTFNLLRYVVNQKAHDLQKPTKIHNQLNSFDGQVTDHYSSILLMWSSVLYFFPQCPSSFGRPDKPPRSHNILVLSSYISNQGRCNHSHPEGCRFIASTSSGMLIDILKALHQCIFPQQRTYHSYDSSATCGPVIISIQFATED